MECFITDKLTTQREIDCKKEIKFTADIRTRLLNSSADYLPCNLLEGDKFTYKVIMYRVNYCRTRLALLKLARTFSEDGSSLSATSADISIRMNQM